MSTTDLIARGMARQITSDLASTLDGYGSGKVGYRAAASSSGRTVQEKLREIVSVKDFGAIGDGTNDDTSAIQAAIDATIGAGGGSLLFPSGTYRISAKLVIPLSYGWRIIGASRLSATIKQFANNTPIFSLETTNTHSFEFCDLTFTWNTPQPAANAASVAIRFGTGTAGHSFYNFQISRCLFEKGFRGVAGDASASPALWGFRVSDCMFIGTMSGASVFAVPIPAVGQPNICIENCLILAQGASEEMIRISSGDVVTLRNLEFLNGAAPLALMQIGGTFAVSLQDCKSENYNVGTGGGQIFKFSQCNVRVFNASINGVLGTGGSSYFLFGNTGTTMSIFGLTAATSMTGGTLYAYTADTAVPIVCDIRLNPTGTGFASDNVRPATGCTPKFDADKRQKDYIADIGDVAVTLTSISDAIQYQNVTLTANRTITLPNTGLYEGMAFHIVRRATTPGAFTLQVTDPIGANNYTFASATNGYVKYRVKNGAWRIVEAGTV